MRERETERERERERARERENKQTLLTNRVVVLTYGKCVYMWMLGRMIPMKHEDRWIPTEGRALSSGHWRIELVLDSSPFVLQNWTHLCRQCGVLCCIDPFNVLIVCHGCSVSSRLYMAWNQEWIDRWWSEPHSPRSEIPQLKPYYHLRHNKPAMPSNRILF